MEGDGLKYRNSSDSDYIKEQQERKKDISWHKCHDFVKGYFWKRYSDDVKIYNFDLHEFNIKYEDFPTLDSVIQEEVIAKVYEKRRLEKEWLSFHPPKPIKLESICMPKIKGGFPSIDINDMCNVQPMTSPIKFKR
jgi:hypothetical protein